MSERICLECKDKLRGRKDQKFCSDYCRNAFNNRQNEDANKYVRRINGILRKNRRILEKCNPSGKITVDGIRLAEEGFEFYIELVHLSRTICRYLGNLFLDCLG